MKNSIYRFVLGIFILAEGISAAATDSRDKRDAPSIVTVPVASRRLCGKLDFGRFTHEDQFHFYDTSSLPPTLRTLPLSDAVSTKRLNGTAMPSDYASRLSLKQLLGLAAFLRSSAANPMPVTLADVVEERSKPRLEVTRADYRPLETAGADLKNRIALFKCSSAVAAFENSCPSPG